MAADFDELFMLEAAFSRGALHVAPSRDIPDPFGVLRGAHPYPSGLRFHRVKGSKHVDLVDTTLPPLRLLSARVVGALSTNGMTGWEADPVIVERSGQEFSDYSLLIVRGRSGPVDDSLSGRTVLPPPDGGRAMPGWKGLFFNDSSWDGTDVFTPMDSGFVCVTRRVKELFEGMLFTNLRFVSLVDVERLLL